jgi:hypothetical protein
MLEDPCSRTVLSCQEFDFVAKGVTYCDYCQRLISGGYFPEASVDGVFDALVLGNVEGGVCVPGDKEASLLDGDGFYGW